MEILVLIFIFIVVSVVVSVVVYGPLKKYDKWINKLISVDIDEERGKINKLMTILNELLTRIKKLEDQNQEINKKLDKLLEDTGEND